MKLPVLPIVAALLSLEAVASDWRFAGGQAVAGGGQGMVFFDLERVETLPNGNVKAWTKTIAGTEYNRVSKKYNKQLVEDSSKKVAAYYVPPYAVVSKADFDLATDITLWEAVANFPATKTHTMVLLEIDCTKRVIRGLSVVTYDDDGASHRSSGQGQWNSVAPDTSEDTLSKILCSPFMRDLLKK